MNEEIVSGKSQVFISYSSSDGEKVRAIVSYMERRGFCCWHDYSSATSRGIRLGEDWLKRIETEIARSAAFLAFLSRGFSRRDVAMYELSLAVKKREADPTYPVVFVFLEPVPIHVFDEAVQKVIAEAQNIQYWKEIRYSGFLPSDFFDKLIGAGWPPCVVDQDRRRLLGLPPWQPGNLNTDAETRLVFDAEKLPERSRHRLFRTALKNQSLSETARNESPFVELPQDDGTTLSFYRLSPEDVERSTVYPAIMDDQWVPPEFYDPTPNAPNAPNVPQYSEDNPFVREFRQHGLTSDLVRQEVIRRQRREIIRCLLHNWQIIVNRAFLVNSEVFRQWYTPDSEEYSAFQSLLGDDSIVIFLQFEDTPLSLPGYAHKSENYDLWRSFCLKLSQDESNRSVACLRFDWNNKSNDFENKSLLGYRFQEFCLTTAENEYRMEAMMRALGVDTSLTQQFRDRWRAVEMDTIAWTRRGTAPYNRSRFYEAFITPRNHTVNEGLVDSNKAFSVQLKQMIDYQYNTNLATALQIQPVFPPQSRLNSYRIFSGSERQRQRELNLWELLVAVEDFSHDILHNPSSFLSDSSRIPEADSANFSLQHLYAIRSSDAWKTYLMELSESKTRSRLNEPDFFNIVRVWTTYRALLEWMQGQTLFSDWNWQNRPSALSVIYHFEEIRLVTVYKAGSLRVFCPENDTVVAESRQNGSLARKTGMYIDYVCGDVEQDPNWENLLLTEIRMFEGMTATSGREVFDALWKSLNGLVERR